MDYALWFVFVLYIFEIWDIDFGWKNYKGEHVELILTTWKEIKRILHKILYEICISWKISDKKKKRNKFFEISPIKFQWNFNENNKKIPILFLLTKSIQFPLKFHHLKEENLEENKKFERK